MHASCPRQPGQVRCGILSACRMIMPSSDGELNSLQCQYAQALVNYNLATSVEGLTVLAEGVTLLPVVKNSELNFVQYFESCSPQQQLKLKDRFLEWTLAMARHLRKSSSQLSKGK